MWRGPKRNFTRRAAALNLGSQEKAKLRCRTEEMMMRLPVERATARTVYEEVRFVHANRAESICGKFPNIQFSWLQLQPRFACIIQRCVLVTRGCTRHNRCEHKRRIDR